MGGFFVDFEPLRTPSSRRRHDRNTGRTEHNKLGLFTGWEDASLAKEGIAEAKRAGQLLRAHGFAVDAVYTSWLSRAIETAWLALQELDALWVPIIKSWRLNERMYGALTGLSKKAILGEHGADAAFSLNLNVPGSRRWRRRGRQRGCASHEICTHR